MPPFAPDRLEKRRKEESSGIPSNVRLSSWVSQLAVAPLPVQQAERGDSSAERQAIRNTGRGDAGRRVLLLERFVSVPGAEGFCGCARLLRCDSRKS